MNCKNPPGLSFDFLDNGSIQHIEVDPIRISLKSATPFSRSGANLWLRKRTKPFGYTTLLGPESNSHFTIEENKYIAKGSWAGLDYICQLQLSKISLSWQWSITIENTSDNPVELDLIYLQDVGLKPLAAGLINEYYVSQYLERRILEDKNHGSVVCCRQNMKESAGNPWLMMACKGRATAASVDGIQFYGNTSRETGIPEGLSEERLGGEYAGESSVIALQEIPFKLSAGENHQSVFMATYLPDHPQATSEHDLNRISGLMHEFGDEPLSESLHDLYPPVRNIFNTSPFLPVDDLSEHELDFFFGPERRHCEEKEGQLLAFFSDQNNHVMLRAKEILVDRPHAHIMQAKTGCLPDENIVSTTAFACGVFNSHLTQGNTNFNILLSVCTSQFNLTPETGQRIFVAIDGRQFLLGVPSAFEMGLNHCRWIYKQGESCFQVRTWTSGKVPQVHTDFRVISGNKVSLIITHHFDETNGWKIYPGNTTGEYVAKPKADSMIAVKFPQAQFRITVNSAFPDFRACSDEVLYPGSKSQGGSLFVLCVQETSDFCMSFTGEVCSAVRTDKIKDADTQWLSDYQDAQSSWRDLSLNLCLKGEQEDTAAIQEILPWYGMNALTHFLTPYGLEQFSGAAWGTRDVAQGPFDLLCESEAFADWLQATSEAIRAGRQAVPSTWRLAERLCFHTYDPDETALGVVWVGVCGPLRFLYGTVRELMNALPWSHEADAVEFILTGRAPVLPLARLSILPHRLPALSRLQLTVDPRLSPREVSGLYRDGRARFTAGRDKPMQDKHIQLAVFCAQRLETNEKWLALREEWNALYPDWAYTQDDPPARRFARDARAAYKRVIGLDLRQAREAARQGGPGIVVREVRGLTWVE